MRARKSQIGEIVIRVDTMFFEFPPGRLPTAEGRFLDGHERLARKVLRLLDVAAIGLAEDHSLGSVWESRHDRGPGNGYGQRVVCLPTGPASGLSLVGCGRTFLHAFNRRHATFLPVLLAIAEAVPGHLR